MRDYKNCSGIPAPINVAALLGGYVFIASVLLVLLVGGQ